MTGHILRCLAFLVAVCGLPGAFAQAQEVRLSEEFGEVSLDLNGTSVVIQRNQDPEAVLSGEYAKTSRACPPNCIQPMESAPGVVTMGELEVVGFLQAEVANGTGVLIDIRLPDAFAQSHLPGAVSVPSETLADENPFRNEILKALGVVVSADGALDFSGAMVLALYGDGAWSATPAGTIRSLIAAGYPAERLKYYRGGMQDWLLLGLTTAGAQKQ